MARLLSVLIVVVSALAALPYASNAQKPTPKKEALPKLNQVHVKILMPTERPVVESWIVEQLKKGEQSRYVAATGWVPVDVSGEEKKLVWFGDLEGESWGYPVNGQISERANGRIKVHLELLDDPDPIPGPGATISLKDEPGSREIASVKELKTKQGPAYVAVHVGPLPEQAAAEGQKSAPKKEARPKFNPVYVKILLPADRPVVESWIAEHLKKRGQSKFIAVTPWVPVVGTGKIFDKATDVWDGGCRVFASITERKDGRIKLFFGGWLPFSADVTVSLTDEPGSREIAVGELRDPEKGKMTPFAYVAVFIGPPPEKAAAPTDQKK
jgi:hypothetical protein